MTLDELQKICDEATPGPWHRRFDSDYYQAGEYLGNGPIRYLKRDEPDYKIPVPKIECSPEQAEYFKIDVCRIESNEADRNFIAAARTYMPELISRIRKLEAERDKLIAVAGAAKYFLEDPSQTHGWKEQLRRALAALERE